MSTYEGNQTKNAVESMLERQGATHDRQSLAKFYDEFAPKEDAEMETCDYGGPRRCAELVNELFKDKNARILDCGVGTGMIGKEMMKFNFTNMDGNDISPVSLNIAKEKSIYKNLVLGDLAEEKLFPDNTYDGLVSVGCFAPGHMTADIFPQWIRVVKPGGYLINVMRAEHIEVSTDHNEGKLEAAIKKLEDEGKWKLVKRDRHANYFIGKDGIAFICQVC